MQFIASRKKFYTLASTLIALSIFAFLFLPKNLGIDMTWGLQIEYSVWSPVEAQRLDAIRENILQKYTFEDKKILSDVLVYSINTTSIRTDIGLVSEENVIKAAERIENLRQQIPVFFKESDVEVTESSFVSVGQSFGDFVLDRAYLNLIVCFVGIAVYLMFAFRKSIEGTSSFAFGAITLITLLHDIIVASGIYIALWLIFPGLKVDAFFVTAILTILGYSINDTIVILDRIRSTYRDKKANDKRSDKQIFEDSIQVSLRRSLYTSMTLIMVLVSMLFFWPEALIWFVTLMLLGAVVGTYSSICLAAPLLYDINSRK
jgi:preprotein translocase SecF subunit